MVILVLGKARNHRVPNLGRRGTESPASLIFVYCSPYMFNTLRCSACCWPSQMWITFKRLSIIFEAFVPHFYLHHSHGIIPKSLLNHLNSFHREIFKPDAKFDADSLLYLLSHSEYDGHTPPMLTHLLPPLTVQ